MNSVWTPWHPSKPTLPFTVRKDGTWSKAIGRYRKARDDFHQELGLSMQPTNSKALAVVFQNFKGPLDYRHIGIDKDNQPWNTFKGGFLLPREICESEIQFIRRVQRLQIPSITNPNLPLLCELTRMAGRSPRPPVQAVSTISFKYFCAGTDDSTLTISINGGRLREAQTGLIFVFVTPR